MIGQHDDYSITVQPGQRFMIASIGKTSGGSSFAVHGELFPPSGTGESVRAFDGITSVELSTSSVARTYTLRISDDGDNATGDYKVTAFVSNGAQDDDDSNDFSDTTDNAPANSGQRNAATAEPGDLDVWRIDAGARQSLTVTVTENDEDSPIDPEVWLVDAQGRLVAHGTNEKGLRLEHLPETSGAYYAVVADHGSNATGVYGITFTRTPGPQYTGDPDTAPLLPNVTRDADLPAGDADVFSIYLAPGENIFAEVARAAGSSLDPRIVLYDPSGLQVAANGNGNTVNVTQTSTLGGTFYVAVFDDESNDGGTYTFRYTLSGSGDGTSPAGGRVRVDTGDTDDNIRVRRYTSDGVDTLEFIINGATRRYYAPEVDQIALYTAGGDDKVSMNESNIRAYVSAGSGDDSVYGSSGNDSLTGGAGRNRLYGFSGDDRLNGSNGRDLLSGESGNDRLYGNGGNDLLDGGGNIDRLFGGAGDDSLLGGTGNDKLYGGDGRDTLIGGRGEDLLRGDAGNDLFRSGDNERDQLFGGGGTDSIWKLDFDDSKDEFPDNDVSRPTIE